MNCTRTDYENTFSTNYTDTENIRNILVRESPMGVFGANHVQACNSTYFHRTDRTVSFAHPQFPEHYDKDQNCFYEVIGPEDFIMIHYVKSFHLEHSDAQSGFRSGLESNFWRVKSQNLTKNHLKSVNFAKNRSSLIIEAIQNWI